MHHLRFVLVSLAGLALLFGASTLPALAAPPANVSPPTAAYLDNQTHSIPANSSLWYQFGYAGDRSQVVLTLMNGTNSGVGFNVFTPAQISDWWELSPIGRGTSEPVNCDTSEPMQKGKCQSSDLMWVGNFDVGEAYYVQVVNNNSTPTAAQLTIQGDGVTLAQ